MVSVDNDGEGGSLEVMSPGIQGTYDAQQFAIIDLVIALSGGE